MYCTKDCSCSLCRELHNLRSVKPAKRSGLKMPSIPSNSNPSSIIARLNENFILRRRASSSLKSFIPYAFKRSDLNHQRNMQVMTALQVGPTQFPFERTATTTPSPTPISLSVTSTTTTTTTVTTTTKPNHKVVIYFGDSLTNRNKSNHQIKNEIQLTSETTATAATCRSPACASKDDMSSSQEKSQESQELPACNDQFIERLQDGILHIKIDASYEKAKRFVKYVVEPTFAKVGCCDDCGSNEGKTEFTLEADVVDEAVVHIGSSDDGDTISLSGSCDWSFVQKWRKRPQGCSPAHQSIPAPTNSPCSPLFVSRTAATTSAPTTPQTTTTLIPAQQKSVRIHSPAVATPAPRISKEVAHRPTPCGAPCKPHSTSSIVAINTNDSSSYKIQHQSQTKPLPPTTKPNIVPISTKPVPHCAMTGPQRLTVQSIPVKSQPALISGSLSQKPITSKTMIPTTLNNKTACPQKPAGHQNQSSQHPSLGIAIENQSDSNHIQKLSLQSPNISKLNQLSTRTHHHDIRELQRVQEYQSSSDENRSSGHASMSDTGGHGSSSPGAGATLGPLPEDRLAAGVTNRSTRSRASNSHSRARHRGTPAKSPWSGSGLEDIKLAIQQLTMRSQTSTSTYSSLSAGSESSEPVRRLGRYSSLETVNTNITTADEFVWVDAHNRLVELQHPPWNDFCIMRVVRNGRCKENTERIAVDALPRLGYLLQRALVRIAREIQRLSFNLGLCSKQEVACAFKIVLCPALADSCIKACLRASAMFGGPSDSALKQSKSARAGLQLQVGRFHRWMADSRLGKFVHEHAAVYLCAGMENLLEEILLQSFPSESNSPLTTSVLEHTIASSGDLWGLLQPFAHLNAGRIASGALTMPRWASQSSLGPSTSYNASQTTVSVKPCLMTTCVGTVSELRDLALRAHKKFKYVTLSNAALTALFYFMRCSQLEHGDGNIPAYGNSGSTGTGFQNVQELCYERAYVVLPPLVEWLRVASAHAEYRSANMIDKDDIMQAARLLLPGVDCPIRPIGQDEELPGKKTTYFQHTSTVNPVSSGFNEDTTELGKRATISMAFKLMLTGRAELLAQAALLLPTTSRYDTYNHAGMTALMLASIRNDEVVIQALLDAGCDPNIEVPSIGHPGTSAIHPDTQHWTAVTFAACRANYLALRVLLERGGKVEGGARLNEEKLTLTPLQVASGSGNVEVISLLLAHGANPFLSTQVKDTLCFAGSTQRGCFCSISVAAAHGQRACLRKLLSHPVLPSTRDVLSLEEMLAEGDTLGGSGSSNGNSRVGGGLGSERGFVASNDVSPILNKMQIKSMQEAMYHSAENNHLDITIELRTLGVPWTLHCWMHALSAAHELRLDAVIDQLLQDFLQVCPDDYSAQFETECLPLLFNTFRYSKNEGTTLLLADIFATCFGWETIKPISEPPPQTVSGSRIDPKFVNNAELSDVTFRVEGKIFYGHKLVLVTASPRFQNMLSSKLNESNAPVVQINDIRYNIFHIVMQYLYSGDCQSLDVKQDEVLELMAAASFFQLDGLLRYTEARCAEIIDIDNVVAMYIHAKVYNANKLLEYCQGFLLQNMVALLTYDDSVKRLLFAKKIPNHDVMSGLLQTLQQRIKQRKPNAGIGSFRQHLINSVNGNNSNFNNVSINSCGNNANNTVGALKKC